MQSSHQSRTQSQQEGGDNEGKGKSVGVTLDAALISRLVQRAGHKDVAEVPSLKIQRSNIRALGNAFFRFRSLHTLVSLREHTYLCDSSILWWWKQTVLSPGATPLLASSVLAPNLGTPLASFPLSLPLCFRLQ